MGTTSELRIFISSTFRDMQEEREHLVKKVFPQIRALCRERGVTFTEIDLRWGLTEEEGALGRIIRTCLEEVDRCRPFFIGIIGDRYGWVPEMHEIMMDPELLYRYPWIEDAAAEGVSLTDLEIRHGVFNHHVGDGTSAYFYHRHPVSSEEITDPPDERLLSLVERIRATGYPLREFRDLEELGNHVAEDLERVIEANWPEGNTQTPLDSERRSHTAFAASRRRSYIATPQHIAAFRTWLGEASNPLVVSGESGLGKSSLVAFLGELFLRDYPEGVLIEHYVGASESTGSAVAVMRHLMEEIRLRFSIDSSLPTAPEEIEAEFGNWLLLLDNAAAETGSPVLIIIDALNQLGPEGRTLAWLPKMIPSHIHLLLSTTPGPSADVLREREWEQLEVTPIDDARIRQSIIVRYLGEFHKGVSAGQLARIAGDRNAASPLFLCVVAEELRLHGEHETLDVEIDRYCDLPALDDVFQVLLERLERDFGENFVRDFFSLLALSRSGLTETELLDLVGATRLDLSRLLFALDYHLIRKEGLLDFFHIYLRHGVERRYLDGEERERGYRLRLARYLADHIDREYGIDREPSGRIALELCHQLYCAGEKDDLAHAMSRLPILRALVGANYGYELISWWRSVEAEHDMVACTTTAIEEMRRGGTSPERLIDFMDTVGSFFSLAARFDAAVPLLERAYRYNRLKFGRESMVTVGSMDHLAEALYHLGDHDAAGRLWKEALEVTESLYGGESPALCPVLDSLCTIAYRDGDIDMAERYCRRSLAISEAVHGADAPGSIDRLKNLSSIQILRENYADAASILERVTQVCLRIFGEDHPTTASQMTEYAYALTKVNRFGEAIEILRSAVAILERTLGSHITLARSLETLGHAYIWTNDPDSAESAYRRALSIRESLQGIDHDDVLWLHVILASSLRRQGKLDEAERILRRVIPLQLERFGPDHRYLRHSIDGIVQVLELAGELPEAEKWRSLLDSGTAAKATHDR